MNSTSSPANRRTEPQPQLAEVIPLRTPTVADPRSETDLRAGEQLAFPLLFLIDGEGGGG